MKEKLHTLIDGLSENQIAYALTFLSKLFEKGREVSCQRY